MLRSTSVVDGFNASVDYSSNHQPARMPARIIFIKKSLQPCGSVIALVNAKTVIPVISEHWGSCIGVFVNATFYPGPKCAHKKHVYSMPRSS